VKKQQSGSDWSFDRLRCALVAVSLALASGCATSQSEVPVIYSRAAPTQITRAYLVVFQGQLDANRAEKLRQALADALQPRTAALVSMLVTGLTLDEPNARADIDAFGPDGVVTVKPTGGLSRQEDSSDAITYDVVVDAPKEKRTVWHASLVSESGPELMARDLVEHLTTAGLLVRKDGGAPPPGKGQQRSK
jgi:hypothetical protein